MPLYTVPLYADLVRYFCLCFLFPLEAQEPGNTGLILFSQSPRVLVLGLSDTGSRLCSALKEESLTMFLCARFPQCLGVPIQLFSTNPDSHVAEEKQPA